METKICWVCKKLFYKPYKCSKSNWINRKFCSRRCHYLFGRENRYCKNCNKEFITQRSIKTIFCSKPCRSEYIKNSPGEYNLFRIGHKGYDSKPWLGKKFTKDHKQKISDSLKNNPLVLKHIREISKKGKEHWNWKGGITEESCLLRNSEEYQFWRNKVYARDNWTCKNCGLKLRNLVAHHIKSFKEHLELRYEINNGITLCRKCHKMIHENIGTKTRFKSKKLI